MVRADATTTLKERLDFVDLGAAEIDNLKALASTIDNALGPALDRFYAKATKHPQTGRFFNNAAHVTHAKGRQISHWAKISSGTFDATYVDAVTAVGNTHARLGLEPRWYIGGYALMMDGIIRAIIERQLGGHFLRGRGKKLANDLSCVVKAALVDMDYAISVYLDALAEQRRAAEAEREVQRLAQDKAMNALAAALEKLSLGDLTAKLNDELAAEFASLKENYNSSVDSLNTAMNNIGATTRRVAEQSGEIASATNDMARRTEQQAAALEEAAAALEQINTVSAQAQARTIEVQSAVSSSAAKAEQSGTVVGEAIQAMSDIEQSSQRMTQIIGTIDEIAFQTNLLALNAGVEAARAGEQGKGFAVVAQEVRELAQRSASAAKEIKVLIGQSSEDVAKGVALVDRTGRALQEIGTQVSSVNELMRAIAKSAEEQAAGIASINSTVSQLDTITQQNAAMAEESSAATARLSSEATELAGLVKHFQLSSTVSMSGATARSAGPALVKMPARRAASGSGGRWEEY